MSFGKFFSEAVNLSCNQRTKDCNKSVKRTEREFQENKIKLTGEREESIVSMENGKNSSWQVRQSRKVLDKLSRRGWEGDSTETAKDLFQSCIFKLRAIRSCVRFQARYGTIRIVLQRDYFGQCMRKTGRVLSSSGRRLLPLF